MASGEIQKNKNVQVNQFNKYDITYVTYFHISMEPEGHKKYSLDMQM